MKVTKTDLHSAISNALNEFDARDSNVFYMIAADDVDGFVERVWNLMNEEEE